MTRQRGQQRSNLKRRGVRWSQIVLTVIVVLLAACSTAEPQSAETTRTPVPTPVATFTAPPPIDPSGPPRVIAPRYAFPALAAFEDNDDPRLMLPIGVPLSGRDYVDAVEESGVLHLESTHPASALCVDGPWIVGVELTFLDEFERPSRVTLWAYPSPSDVSSQWTASEGGEPDARELLPSCTAARLMAPRVDGRTWAAANLVVSIQQAATVGSETLLLGALRSLAPPVDEVAPGETPS